MADDDTNPERRELTADIRAKLERMQELEAELASIRASIASYVEWNHTDAQAVRQNMALRDDETGERR